MFDQVSEREHGRSELRENKNVRHVQGQGVLRKVLGQRSGKTGAKMHAPRFVIIKIWKEIFF